MRVLAGARRAVVLVVLGLLLAACGTVVTDAPKVTVTGSAGQAPTVTYLTPLSVDATHREVVWPGTGAELVDGAPVLIDFWLENATDASLVKESYSTSPTPRMLTVEDLGTDLYETLKGQQVGARLLQVAPGGSDPVNAIGYGPKRRSASSRLRSSLRFVRPSWHRSRWS